MRPPLSSRTNSRPTAPLGPDAGFDVEFVVTASVMLFSFTAVSRSRSAREGACFPPARSTDRTLFTDPKPLTQKPLQDLAAPAFGQLAFRELDVARDLVVGEEPPTMSDQIIGAERSSGLAHHARRHELAPLRVGYSEDCRFQNRRMLVNDGLDLAGIDILSTRDDHVLRAVEDVEIAVRVAAADVARSKHSVLERELGLLRIVPVSGHDVGAARHQLATLSWSKLLSGAVHD